MDSYYHIVVGEKRPLTRKLGDIERNTGFSVAKEKGETLAKRGDCGFPNSTQVWAVRLNKEGKIPKDANGNFIQLQPTDSEYKGKLLGLKWGQEGGSIVEVRYLKGYPSLDKLYQERILNFKVDETNENSAEVFMLMFPNGDNDIPENVDPLLVQHLKMHPYNRDSISKDPAFFTHMFYEKSFEQEERLDSQILDAKFDAAKIVREAGSGGDSTSKCKNLLAIIESIVDERPEDNKVYAYLKMIADVKPGQFLKAIDDYKRRVSDVFEKLKSYETVDLTVDGTIAAEVVLAKGAKKKELIVSDLPAKGEGMFEYMLENFTDPKVFDATFKLIKITDKYK